MRRFNAAAGTAAAATLLALLVLGAELVPAFEGLLGVLFWHHWIAKLVLVALALLVTGYATQAKSVRGVLMERCAWCAMLVSMAVIFVFYAIHYSL